jgi:hypothetical protein
MTIDASSSKCDRYTIKKKERKKDLYAISALFAKKFV